MSTVRQTKIANLHPNRRGLIVEFKIIKLEAARTVKNRRDGSTHRVADILVGDETGCILLTLWDDNIAQVQEGKVFRITNGQTGLFQERLRLSLGPKGELQPSTVVISEVNTENNLSMVRHAQKDNRRGHGRRDSDRSHPVRRRKGFKWTRVEENSS